MTTDERISIILTIRPIDIVCIVLLAILIGCLLLVLYRRGRMDPAVAICELRKEAAVDRSNLNNLATMVGVRQLMVNRRIMAIRVEKGLQDLVTELGKKVADEDADDSIH